MVTTRPWSTLFVVVSALLAGFLVMIVGFLLATVLPGIMTIQHALAVSALIGFASAGAVFSAILPRDKGWVITRRRAPGQPAWAYYVTSGFVAMLLQIPFSLIFRLGRTHDLGAALQMLWRRDVGGWLWLSFVLAAGLAALVDRDVPLGLQDWGRAAWLFEGLLLSAATGFTGLLIALLLGPAGAPLPPVIAMLSVLGAVLGATVPSMYRGAPRTQTAALTEGAPTATRVGRELPA